ncbi:hypothetical protein ACHAQA_001167 [Verticillium albo-atrum]
MAESKTTYQTSNFEVDTPAVASFGKLRALNALDAARAGLTLLALCAGATVLGVSADALAVYDATHVRSAFMLPLWPDDFDLRPTVALVACSSIVVLANIVSLAGGKISFIRDNFLAHTALSFLAPLASLTAAIVAVGLSFVIRASTSNDTLHSWSCRWEGVYMAARPHFGTLCKQSRVGLYLTVLLVPLEVLVLGAAVVQAVLERNAGFTPREGRRNKERSPTPSS